MLLCYVNTAENLYYSTATKYGQNHNTNDNKDINIDPRFGIILGSHDAAEICEQRHMHDQ